MTPSQAFVWWCLEQLGAPVLWAAKGPDVFDCSGLVTAALRACGWKDWTTTHNTDRLWAELERPPFPAVGDLAFWWSSVEGAQERGDVEHVAVLLPNGWVLTADGASSRIRDLAEAKRTGARVRVRDSVTYRPRFAGYRANPLRTP